MTHIQRLDDPTRNAAIADLARRWREEGIANVRFELPDMHGTSRSKIVPIAHLESYSARGLNMYGGTVVLDSRSDVVPGTLYNEEVAYADQLLFPDPNTAARVPWMKATGRLICDPYWADGRPLAAAPRHVFRRVLERCHDLGYEPMMGIEPEFYLLDPATHAPLFDGYHIFNTVRNNYVPLIDRIIAELGAYGIDIITANCEYAGSQWEINYAPVEGMAGPDVAFSFKNAVKELAFQEGLLATFMSKPFANAAGSGAHHHLSLSDRTSGKNVLGDPEAEWGLSKIGRSFIAGQLRHARSVYAIIAPTVNCMKRRRPHTFSPTNVSWGVEDRSALVRVKSGSPEHCHVENRAPTGLSNPYLVSAALLGTGLLGVEDGLELEPPARPPAEEDPTKTPLPESVTESLDLFEHDERLIDLFGEEFVTAYLAMRRHELARYADHVTDWERDEYLELY
jgi:glutamine synthetase